MKKIIISLLIVIGFFSCEIKTEEGKRNIEDLSDEEFISIIEPYMAESSVLEVKAIIEDIPSPVKALRDTVVDILQDQSLSPVDVGSDIYKHFGKVFLEQVKIEEPILFYTYMNERYKNESFSYLLYATHPSYGEVLVVQYSNNSTDENFKPGSKLYNLGNVDSIGPQLISQSQAKEYMESVLGVTLDKEPIAVRLPDGGHSFYSPEDFAWYCAVPDSHDSRAIADGNYEEYLLDPWVYDRDIKSAGSRGPEEWNLDPRDGDSSLPTRVSRIDKKLNIYGILDSLKGTPSRYTQGMETPVIYDEVEILPF